MLLNSFYFIFVDFLTKEAPTKSNLKVYHYVFYTYLYIVLPCLQKGPVTSTLPKTNKVLRYTILCCLFTNIFFYFVTICYLDNKEGTRK